MPVAARTPFFAANVSFRALFSMLARGQTGHIDIQHQEALSRVVMPHGLPFTYVDTADGCTSWLYMDSGKTIAGISDGRLLGEAVQAPCLGSHGIRSDAGVAVGDGMTTAHHAHEACDQLFLWCVVNAFLLQPDLLMYGSEEITLLQAISQ